MAAVLGAPGVVNDLSRLAPVVRTKAAQALIACQARGLDAIAYETQRSHELAVLYYARGRTVIPPTKTVTNAPDETYTWHGYGLALDIIHRTKQWSVPDQWFRDMADVFKQFGFNSGLDWKKPDPPHVQWHLCKPSPSSRARQLLAAGQLQQIWIELQAA